MKGSIQKILRCAIALLLLAVPALAWETDTHYGLTKWLAVKAGFTLQEAEAIALGTQEPDEGSLYPAPRAVITYACEGRDVLASRFVQEHHFPSYGPIPSDASKRVVVPGLTDNAANLWARKEIAAVVRGVSPEWALRTFGNSLHPLQDSWAHQGEPDMPMYPCSKQLAWGHPKARGGWRKHDADLTYKHEADTLATAKKTDEMMLAYRKARGMSVSAAPSWASLEPAVKAFADAKTKEEKRTWFESDPEVPFSSYSKQDFLDQISLPKKESFFHFSGVTHPQKEITLVSQSLSSRQMCVEDFVKQFLTIWIEERDFKGALQFIDTGAVAASLRGEEVPSQLANIEPATLAETMLASWLVADHGAVNLFGHGQLEPGFQILMGARFDRENFAPIPHAPISEVLRTSGGTSPFTVSRMHLSRDARKDSSESYSVVFQFAHTPHDVIQLMMEKRAGDWVVAQFDWVAM
jgi:hypothetical protein